MAGWCSSKCATDVPQVTYFLLCYTAFTFWCGTCTPVTQLPVTELKPEKSINTANEIHGNLKIIHRNSTFRK